ncbi:UTP--glucose-1-phosphate uridylyltransferase GalU [Paenibacillus sp. GCM10023248]|uniref:UTP--glucose-1-phosphate uridylyltransferase GalU n=1 Tax=Bacillales TaxID=1385 RepID=UPI0023780805|nr:MULTISPECIES: UTP--glucose-1-phosphate uridylyltransferase GalU [Bacillales]MDD9269976.1 UTP--glucose-1-phosphate uridylyltransferase GalU [Paenibacillus sp. MAHUQ-63]MDR6883197.1 UTP--glucose-1-phosphate uridylyltransferase [Bacillus sp. 3255]
MGKIKKAIIPAAGLGTRFLPATKAMPKEMLPIVDKPTIQYIVEEAVESGIEDIIIVTGRSKRSIEDHFDINYELEFNLREKNKQSLLKIVDDISNMVDIHYVRQKQALGLGHAIWCARKFIGNEPFAVLLGDMVIDSNPPCLKQLIQIYEEKQSSVIAVKEVAWPDVGMYGIVDGDLIKDGLYQVKALVEKPVVNPPSNTAIVGRYILEPDIFEILACTPSGAGDEIQLTDAMQELMKRQPLYAYKFVGNLYDVGDKLGFLKATVELACKNKELQEEFKKYLYRVLAEDGGSL